MYIPTYVPQESDQPTHSFLSGPEVIKSFFMLNSAEHEICPANKSQITGDQEVPGLTPAKVGNILSWRLIMKYFLRSFSSFR